MLPDNAIKNILAESLTLEERLINLKHTQSQSQNSEFDYVSLWKSNFDDDVLQHFEKRLLWEGLREDELPFLFSNKSNSNYYEWHGILKKIIFAISNIDSSNCKYKFSSKKYKIPFQDFFYFIINIAETELLHRVQSKNINDFFTDKALNDLKSGLLLKLSEICSPTLLIEFGNFRSKGSVCLSKFFKNSDRFADDSEDYKMFISEILNEKGVLFFTKYPVLSKLIAITVENWIQSNIFFIDNTIAEFERIVKFFIENHQENIKRIKINRIKTNLSDYHNNGKNVYILQFTDKSKIVYKPKCLQIDASYNSFLDWINNKGFSVNFKITKILRGLESDYGFSEFIGNKKCKKESEVNDFFFKSGALLCVLHLLRATDCHFENLIAHKGDLILIDCETLLQPTVDSDISKNSLPRSNSSFFSSVLRSDFLPIWKFDKNHEFAYDISGIGPIDNVSGISKKLGWININTDEMSLELIEVKGQISKNIPVYNKLPVNSCEYTDIISKGFCKMYNFFIENRSVLLEENGPLEIFKNIKIRFIFRATEVYGFVLLKANRPEYLKNGLFYSIKLDILSRAHLWSNEKTKLWNIFEHEIKALNNLDIPYFGITSETKDIEVNGEKIDSYFKQTGYEDMISTVLNLSKIDMENQIDIIEGSLYSRKIIPNSAVNTFSNKVELQTTKILEYEHFVSEAIGIANRIISKQFIENGNISWRTLTLDIKANVYQYKPIGLNLYSGKCGIALFMAALYSITNESKFKETALLCISELFHAITKPHSIETIKGIGSMGIGGADGIGSIIYSLVKIGTFLDDYELIKLANSTTLLISENLITDDTNYDVIGGSAGCILSLLKLSEKTNNKNVLDLAILCGKKLVNHSHHCNNVSHGIKNTNEISTGFSHGASGISYALLMLYNYSLDVKFKEAAVNLINYEQSQFDDKIMRNLDLRFSDFNNSMQNSWCHGPSGIVLGRMGALSVYHNDKIIEEIETGVLSILNYDLKGVDHMCCGNFGRLESLLYYAIQNKNNFILDQVYLSASCLVNRAKENGGYLIHQEIPNKFVSPSFFQGLSGVGYQLLRIAEPNKIPSVLLFH